MRQDLAKLMVERPRGGWDVKIHKRKHNQRSAWLEGDAPLRGSMSRSRGTKWLNEYFSPLIRILRSQRGVLWDEVYSQIAAQIRPSNVVQKHVLDHLFQFVMTETWLEEGQPYGKSDYGNPIRLDQPGQQRDRFYVCPRTRKLKELVYEKPQKHVAKSPQVWVTTPGLQIRRVEDIWFALVLSKVPKGPGARRGLTDRLYKVALSDLVNSESGRLRLLRAYGSDDVYAEAKHQLGKKELRRLGLDAKSSKSKNVPAVRSTKKAARKR